MSTGRRDYTWGFLNEAAGEGRYRESFSKYFACTIGSELTVEGYTYTVPANKRLGICKIHFSCDSGGYHNVNIRIDEVTFAAVTFTGKYVYDFTEINPLYVTEGQIFDIQLTNKDDVSVIYYGGVNGVLESLIS